MVKGDKAKNGPTTLKGFIISHSLSKPWKTTQIQDGATKFDKPHQYSLHSLLFFQVCSNMLCVINAKIAIKREEELKSKYNKNTIFYDDST
jgi:hypothetical protein